MTDRFDELRREIGRLKVDIGTRIAGGDYDRQQAIDELTAASQQLRVLPMRTRQLVLGPLVRFMNSLPADDNPEAMRGWAEQTRRDAEALGVGRLRETEDGQ